MEIELLKITELRRLLNNATIPAYLNSFKVIKYVSAIDIFCEVERIKKREIASPILNRIKSGTCDLFYAINIGCLIVAALNSLSLEDGLFQFSDDYCSVELWETAINRSLDPAQSSILVTLRCYDKWMCSDLSEAALALFTE